MNDILKKLQEQEAELLLSLTNVRIAINAEKLRLAENKFGVKIGSIVTWKGNEYRVTDIKDGYRKPWLLGNPKKKDGAFGISIRHLYNNWELKS